MWPRRREVRFGAQLRRVAAGITRAAPLPRGKRRVANMVGDWLAAPQQSEPRIVRMAAGFSLHVDLSSKNQRRMYFSGLYEPNVTRLFQTLLTTGDTVIDGGANIGYYSLLGSQCVGEGGAVHAFEPVPSTFRALGREYQAQCPYEYRCQADGHQRQLAGTHVGTAHG